MRGYIFTETEREQLKRLFKEGKESKTLQVPFSGMRRTDIMEYPRPEKVLSEDRTLKAYPIGGEPCIDVNAYMNYHKWHQTELGGEDFPLSLLVVYRRR